MIKKIIAIVGPTGSGKSDLAVQLAKKFKGEIISADSRQIYKGMDIGTGKIAKKEMRGVPHHLLSFVSPRRKFFSAAEFKSKADAKIKQIERRSRLPILAGGTGFWIDTVAFNLNFPEVPPNPVLRAKLGKLTTAQLFAKLKKLNPERTKNIDAKNPRRLIRSIEIAEFFRTKKQRPAQNPAEPTHKVLFIGMDMPDKILYGKIRTRLLKRIRQGMIAEVSRLRKSGVSWKKLEDFGLEYRYVSRFLRGELNKEQMIEELYLAIKHYAKRQRTWFKRNAKINWLNAANKKTALGRSFKLVENFLVD